MSTSARLILGLAMFLIAPAANPGPPPPTVVVAELFTSEGCSSCPPADTLMRQPADVQPFDGVHLIALEEHVDYWDRLGVRDELHGLHRAIASRRVHARPRDGVERHHEEVDGQGLHGEGFDGEGLDDE